MSRVDIIMNFSLANVNKYIYFLKKKVVDLLKPNKIFFNSHKKKVIGMNIQDKLGLLLIFFKTQELNSKEKVGDLLKPD